MDSTPDAFDVAVTVCSAAGLAKKDVFGLSDPYVKIALIQKGEVAWKARTPTVEKSLNPKWNKTFIMRVDSAHAEEAKIVFNVFDANRLTRDDFLGRVEISVKSIPTRSGSDAVQQRFELQQRTYKSRVSGCLFLILLRVPDGGPRASDDAVWRPSRSSISTPPQGSPTLELRSPTGNAVVGTAQAMLGEQQPVTGWHSTSRHEEPLPANWEQRVDNLGRRFYVNHSARTVQWERPVPSDQQQSAVTDEQRRQEAALMFRRRHHASQDDSEQEPEQQPDQQLQPLGQQLRQRLQQQQQDLLDQQQQQQELLERQQLELLEQQQRQQELLEQQRQQELLEQQRQQQELLEQQRQQQELLEQQQQQQELLEQQQQQELLEQQQRQQELLEQQRRQQELLEQQQRQQELLEQQQRLQQMTIAEGAGRTAVVTPTTTSATPRAVPQPSGAAAVSNERPVTPAALAALPPAPAVAVPVAPNEVPLPSGWVQMLSPGGRIFFIDHNTRTTTWNDPRLSIPPAALRPSNAPRRSLLTSNDPTKQLGPLPSGWEEMVHTNGRKFYIDHNTKTTQWEDPRLNKLRGTTVEYSLAYKQKFQHFRSRLPKTEGSSKFVMKVSRANILEESFREIMKVKNVNSLRSRLWIEFIGEHAYDYGGLSREWFFLVSREIFNPYYGLFEYSAIDNYTLQINNQSGMANSNHLDYFHFLGRLMGMAAYHNKLLDGFFIQPLYKLMLRKPIVLGDMESVDLEYYNSLKWIMENDIQHADLDLTFSVEVERYGKMLEVELKPRGKEINVTNKNKAEYVGLIIKWRFEDSIKMQLSAMMKGFNELVPQSEIMIFDENELELLLCGVQDIDVNDWKVNTTYKGGYHPNHPTIINFWRMVYSLDNEGRARLLQFSTGTSRVPVNGFAELYGSNGPLKFCIEKVGTPNQLPRSHTCFNRLDLPPYDTYEELRQKVLMALESTDIFDGVD